MTLTEYNARGLIPGPEEPEESYFCRVRKAVPTPARPCSSLAKELFDIEPDWVGVTYDKKGLQFWEGGCTWIEEDKVTLQLREEFEKKERFLRIYSKEELIAHELVHVVRQLFEEPIFEEVLAYQTSASKFRRFWGPIFRTPTEVITFIIVLLSFFIITSLSSYQLASCIGLTLFMGGCIFRLLRTQRIFSHARSRLAAVVGIKNALPLMLRLTDGEIAKFSKMDAASIVKYAYKMGKIDIRWKMLLEVYFGVTQIPIQDVSSRKILQESALSV